MARPSRTSSEIEAPAADGEPERPVCGVIMPISATSSHGEQHWSDVQTLLHRAIDVAGFRPQNVWENTSIDRISERIVGNIFDKEIVVADISDLNPNVMLELGLRLASKRPTIAVVNSGGTIPFDIRDFHVLDYPSDMNMLGMEKFFAKLKRALEEKHSAYKNDNYTPFLGNVIVDVVTPEKREVSADEAVLSRLDEIGYRITRLERRVPVPRASSLQKISDETTSDLPDPGVVIAHIPEQYHDQFSGDVSGYFEIDEIRPVKLASGRTVLSIRFSALTNADDFRTRLRSAVAEYDGRLGSFRPG